MANDTVLHPRIRNFAGTPRWVPHIILVTMCPMTQCYIPGYVILQEHHVEYLISQDEFGFHLSHSCSLRRDWRWGMAEWMVIVCVCVCGAGFLSLFFHHACCYRTLFKNPTHALCFKIRTKTQSLFNPLAYTDVPETAGLARSINTQPAVRRNSETNPTSQHNRGMYWSQ